MDNPSNTKQTFPSLKQVIRWYVMRDLKRSNTLSPAYKVLREKHLEVFTPMQWKIRTRNRVKIREQAPFIPDLLFVHASKKNIDPFVEKIPTLQYRYVRGGYKEEMTVKDAAMNKFICAVNTSSHAEYFKPSEITPQYIGSNIRIIGGPLNGYTGHLLKVRGSRKRRLLVEIPDLITAAIEVKPEFIQILE